MGLYLWSYAVDLKKLAAVWGSKDKALARRTIAKADVADNAESFSDAIEEGAPTLDRAIQEIVDGKLTAKKHAFQYTYAVVALCQVLGTRVGDELKYSDWYAKVLDPALKKVHAKKFEALMRLDPPARPLKVPASDIPFLSSMTLDEVNVATGAFARLAARLKTEPPKYEHQEGFEFVMAEVRARLVGATRRRRGLVNFLY